jgi:DNA ligase-associated metallophosphoesterase
VNKDLPRVSPFAVPLILEIGREIVYGASADAVLEEAETKPRWLRRRWREAPPDGLPPPQFLSSWEGAGAEHRRVGDRHSAPTAGESPTAPHPALRATLPRRGGIGLDRLRCGSLNLAVNGTAATLRCSGALWLAEHRMLVVGDLHLEKGSSYATRGVMLPPFDTRATLLRLEGEVAELEPAMIVLLGDTFHDGRAIGRLAFDDRLRVEALARGRTLVWVVGNHDAEGPGPLPGEVAAEVAVAGLTLRHEPQRGGSPGRWRAPAPLRQGAGARRAVRRRCFITDGERVILPAFGAYAGGLNVLDRAYAGMFGPGVFVACLGETKVPRDQPGAADRRLTPEWRKWRK